MPGAPSAGRKSMIAGASTAMSNLYCRTGEKEFAEKAVVSLEKARAAGSNYRSSLALASGNGVFRFGPGIRSNEKEPDA
jgi:hypothetical protein